MQQQRMTPEAWRRTEQLAREAGLGDAQIAGLAIGCPRHGNRSMDFDEDGVFCHACDRESRASTDGYDVTAVTADAMFVPIVASAELGTAHVVAAKTAQDARFWEVRVIRASDGVIVRTYPTVAR